MSLRLACLLCLAPVSAAQSVWHVDGSGVPPGSGSARDPYTSIQYAASQASTKDGDSLRIQAGTYLESVDLQGKSLSLEGEPGTSPVVIDAGGLAPVVRIDGATVTLQGLTLQGGYGDYVATERRGGGVLIQDSTVSIEGCVIRSNRGSKGAGIHARDSVLTIRDTNVVQNTGEPDAGTNQPGYGVGLFAVASQVDIAWCSFSDNGGRAFGGGLCAWHETVLTVRDTVIDANQSLGPYDTRGNGVFSIGDAEVLMQRCTLSNNRSNGGSTSSGAGYYGPGRLEACLIQGNQAWLGGGAAGYFSDWGRLTLVKCQLLNNKGSAGGGAAYARLEDCTLEANSASSGGGGATHSLLLGGIVRSNTAGSPVLHPGLGAGLSLCEATGVLIEGNRGVGQNGLALGAGLYLGSAKRCIIRDNRFVGPADSKGGGAFGATLEQCTLLGNSADSGGGIEDSAASSCIVWGNTPDQVVGGGVAYSTVEGGAPGPNNLSGDPQFWLPLGADLHLKPGSPCIDAGNPLIGSDPDGSLPDQGALHLDPSYCGAPASWCVPTPSSNGCAALMQSSGSPSLTGPDDFLLYAEPARNQELGWLLWSAVAAESPFQGGTLCLGGTISRSAPISSGGDPDTVNCSGRLTLAFPQSRMADLGLVPGTTLYAQFVHRDPGGGQALGLSDALEFTLCP